MATIEVNVEPFSTPNYVVREDGGESLRIEDLPKETFTEMMWDFIRAMEDKTGHKMHLRSEA